MILWKAVLNAATFETAVSETEGKESRMIIERWIPIVAL